MSQLYLASGLRQNFLDDLSFLKATAMDRLFPIFSDIEKEAKDYENELFLRVMKESDAENRYVDPGDHIDQVHDDAIDRYNLLRLMQYRNLTNWIVCMCQVWEQQLISFILNEAETEGIKYNQNDIDRGFPFVQKIFEEHHQPFAALSSWPKIHELRLLVNVLKHAEGRSERELRDIRPDLFVEEFCGLKYDLVSLYHTTLVEPALQISETDFEAYYHALHQFWLELPEYMYKS